MTIKTASPILIVDFDPARWLDKMGAVEFTQLVTEIASKIGAAPKTTQIVVVHVERAAPSAPIAPPPPPPTIILTEHAPTTSFKQADGLFNIRHLLKYPLPTASLSSATDYNRLAEEYLKLAGLVTPPDHIYDFSNLWTETEAVQKAQEISANNNDPPSAITASASLSASPIPIPTDNYDNNDRPYIMEGSERLVAASDNGGGRIEEEDNHLILSLEAEDGWADRGPVVLLPPSDPVLAIFLGHAISHYLAFDVYQPLYVLTSNQPLVLSEWD